MNFVAPESLIFWTTIIFLAFFFLLKKLAWKPILNAVKEREDSINDALLSAEKARLEMQNLKSDNERILKEARNERDAMLKDAREIREKLIAESKEEALKQSAKLIEQAKFTIENEKQAAIVELKNQVAELSISIAEKVIKEELSSKDRQLKVIGEMLKDVKLN
ncbi:MAG TPA: F0F1 ATP synthase subunit B [Flavobacteriaceae bacterium]|jgi:F-type H+-transporting ATPase subunit b|nr:F0F1 ATP synthase subunit B [Flavobacteriaceae bacterium]